MSVPSLALHNMECFHLFFCRVMGGIARHDSGAMAAHTLPYMSKVKSLFFEGVELESVFAYIKHYYFLNTSLEESIKN